MFLSQILKLVPMCGLVWCRSGVSTYNVEIANKLQTGEWFQVPDLALRDHYLVVPLDYENPKGSSITIFVREVVAGMQPRFSHSFQTTSTVCVMRVKYSFEMAQGFKWLVVVVVGLLRDGHNVIVWSTRYWSLYEITVVRPLVWYSHLNLCYLYLWCFT